MLTVIGAIVVAVVIAAGILFFLDLFIAPKKDRKPK